MCWRGRRPRPQIFIFLRNRECGSSARHCDPWQGTHGHTRISLSTRTSALWGEIVGMKRRLDLHGSVVVPTAPPLSRAYHARIAAYANGDPIATRLTTAPGARRGAGDGERVRSHD